MKKSIRLAIASMFVVMVLAATGNLWTIRWLCYVTENNESASGVSYDTFIGDSDGPTLSVNAVVYPQDSPKAKDNVLRIFPIFEHNHSVVDSVEFIVDGERFAPELHREHWGVMYKAAESTEIIEQLLSTRNDARIIVKSNGQTKETVFTDGEICRVKKIWGFWRQEGAT